MFFFVILSQAKAVKNKENRLVLQFLQLKLIVKHLKKHLKHLKKNQYLKICPVRIEIFLQTYVGYKIIKQICNMETIYVPHFCYKIKCEI